MTKITEVDLENTEFYVDDYLIKSLAQKEALLLLDPGDWLDVDAHDGYGLIVGQAYGELATDKTVWHVKDAYPTHERLNQPAALKRAVGESYVVVVIQGETPFEVKNPLHAALLAHTSSGSTFPYDGRKLQITLKRLAVLPAVDTGGASWYIVCKAVCE